MMITEQVSEQTVCDTITIEKILPTACLGLRLDQALAQVLPDFSRSLLQQWIKQGGLTLDGQPCTRATQKIRGGEAIRIIGQLRSKENWSAEDIPLDVVYQDQDLIVVNKPAGLVTHPATGHPSHTLVNALLRHAPELEHLPRAGLIHRLDKDTSGLLVVARNRMSHHALVAAMQARNIERQYLAICHGQLADNGRIDAPIKRHPKNRIKMAVVSHGKHAVTHFQVIARWQHLSLVKIKLETGRTHQIRVHFAHRRHPLLGDKTYGKKLYGLGNFNNDTVNLLESFQRQALHAQSLHLIHPRSQKSLTCSTPIPHDLQQLITSLGAP